MTAARVGVQYIETVATSGTTARIAVQYIEIVALDTVKARVGVQYIEIVVGAPGGGWFMDALPMDLL